MRTISSSWWTAARCQSSTSRRRAPLPTRTRAGEPRDAPGGCDPAAGTDPADESHPLRRSDRARESARHETLRELREFFATRAEGGDSVTVAVFEQNLRVLLLPSSDRARIHQALEELENRPSLARLGNGERMQLQHDIRNYGRDAARFPPRFRLAEAQRIEHEIVAWAEQQLDRQQRSIAALAQMVDALAAA